MTSLDVLDEESLVARFASRAVAEQVGIAVACNCDEILTSIIMNQALARGSNIPSVGPVRVGWFTDTQPTKPTTSTAASEKKISTFADDRPLSPRPEDIQDAHDEHVQDDSGWGDEDGMGMF